MTVLTGTDRFDIRRCLGSGSFGVVYEAFDRDRQMRVALKFPHAGTAHGLYLFKQEFRSLADVTHPNLINLFELLTDGDRWFFTMELVDGLHVLDFLRQTGGPEGFEHTSNRSTGDAHATESSVPILERTGGPVHAADVAAELMILPSPPPDYDRVRGTLRQLAQGLTALHAAGMLHRDLKPSNVLVTREGRVVILDFGLVTDLENPSQGERVGGGVAGTPAYMSPEQIAEHRTTAASDWYSVGVMLYQALTGRLPFAGGGRAMLTQKLQQDPLEPRFLVPETPADLEDLCLALLHREASARPRGQELLERLQHVPLSRLADMETRTRLLNMVGRSAELEELVEGFRLTQGGRAVAALLHGESGTGKSTLVRTFLRKLRDLDERVVVLQGRCYEQESVPFKAVDSLIDALSEHLKRLPASDVAAFFPSQGQALARLFPVLNQVPFIAELPPAEELPDAQEVRRRAFGALREILRRMSLEAPLVLTIDDIQWGDMDSVALLTELLRSPDPPPLMLILCYRSADVTVSPVLQELLPQLVESVAILQDFDLRPLSREEARDLASVLLGPEVQDAWQQAEWIAAESGGNPFFVQELAHHVRVGDLEETDGEGRLDRHIRRRVECLADDSRAILQTLAVAGYPLPWEVVQGAAGVAVESIAVLPSLRAGHLIRMGAGTQRRILETYHDRIRDAVVQYAGEERVRELNLALAHTLEERGSTDVQALARHFEAGGGRAKAAVYMVQAAVQAEASLAFDQAAVLYRRALSLRTSTDSESPALWRRLGDALVNAGRSFDAAEAYLRAAEGAPNAESNRLQRRAAEEYFRSGNIASGLSVLRNALAFAGARMPATRTGTLASLLWHRLRLAIRGLAFRERTLEEIPSAELERVDTYWAVAMGLGPVDVLRGADFQTRQLLLTLKAGEPFRVVRALSHEIVLVAAGGNRALERTRSLCARTVALAERIGHPNPRARALMATGIAETILGRWRCSIERLEEAERILRQHCTGMDYELHLAQHQALLSRLVIGDLLRIRERLPALLQEAREKGDLIALTNLRASLSYILRLAKDDPGRARRDLYAALDAWPRQDFHLQHYHHLVSSANVELYDGAHARAHDMVMQARDPLRRSLLLKLQPILITMAELRGRTALGLAARAPSPQAAHRLLCTAQKEVSRLRRERTAYGGALALKLEAMASAIQGQAAEALAGFERAELTFDACDMPLHAMSVRLVRGHLLGETGRALIASAEAWMQSQGIQNPRRFAAMHVPLKD